MEKAIHETRTHALDQYNPVTPLEKLLWNKKPIEMPDKLFAIQTKGVKEEIPSVFHVAFQCTLPGLEQFRIGEKHQRVKSKSTCIGKWLILVMICSIFLNLTLAGCPTQRDKVERDLVEAYYTISISENREAALVSLNLKLEDMSRQLEMQKADFQAKDKQCVSLEIENKILSKLGLSQAIELTGTKATLEKNLNEIAEANKKNSILEARLKSWGITSDPPNESPHQDQDIDAFTKLGPDLNRAVKESVCVWADCWQRDEDTTQLE